MGGGLTLVLPWLMAGKGRGVKPHLVESEPLWSSNTTSCAFFKGSEVKRTRQTSASLSSASQFAIIMRNFSPTNVYVSTTTM